MVLGPDEKDSWLSWRRHSSEIQTHLQLKCYVSRVFLEYIHRQGMINEHSQLKRARDAFHEMRETIKKALESEVLEKVSWA